MNTEKGIRIVVLIVKHSYQHTSYKKCAESQLTKNEHALTVAFQLFEMAENVADGTSSAPFTSKTEPCETSDLQTAEVSETRTA